MSSDSQFFKKISFISHPCEQDTFLSAIQQKLQNADDWHRNQEVTHRLVRGRQMFAPTFKGS